MKIKKIDIYRMPGFPTGLKAFEKLAGNVNVIAGPNGSGKSSTARVIQKLIWWNNKNTGYQVEAQIDINGESNRVEVDSQNYTRTTAQERTHDDFSFISSEEFSNQYMLALHDLVKDNDNNLAAIIAREVNGGVDLNAVSSKLNYKNNTPNLGHQCFREYTIANELYHKHLKEQTETQKEEESLSLLEEEKKRADEARKYTDWYEKALNYLRTKERYTLTNERMSGFPASIARMKEDDLITIENLEQKLNGINTLLEESATNIQSKKDKIAALRIPQTNQIPEELPLELTEKAARLKESVSGITSCEREIAKLRVAYNNALANLNAGENAGPLANLKLTEIRDLSEFTRSANETHGIYNNLANRKARIEEELANLKNVAGFEKYSADDLKEGISILSNWLKGKSTTVSTSSKPWLVWALPLWGILCILIGYFAGIIGLITGVILSACLIPAMHILNKKKPSQNQSELDVRIADYERKNLPPVSWDSDSVATKIQELLLQLDILDKKAATEKQLKEISYEIEKTKAKLTEINSSYQQLKQDMGVLPENIEPLVDNYNSFYVFLCHVQKLQEAATELEKYTNEKLLLTSRYDRLLDEINALLRQINFPVANDPEQATAIINSFSLEKRTLKEAVTEIENNEKIIALKEKEKEDCRKTLEEIYSRLEIPFGQKNDVFLLNNEFPVYRKTRELLNEDTAHLNANYKLLQDHSLFEAYQQSIAELTIDEAQAKIDEYKQLSGRQEELLQRISDIKAQIKEKSSQNDVEVSLNRKEEALSGLNDLLRNNLKSLTGSMIVSQLHDEISLNNENLVFKRANKILGSITKGRYSLILSEGLQPTFKAYDNIQNHIQSLTEISTGTRVQLLLAIRLAYIESQENNIKLPILADELLANSDDERSEAIIRSLIEISRNRQLFYFTAQADEVEKWNQYLKANPELDAEIILLPGKINKYNKQALDVGTLKLIHDICPPTGFTHEEYGAQVGVGPFDLLEQEVTEMHLWYLIEDTRALYSCLQHGFYQWGQLNSYLDNAGTIPGLDDSVWENMKTKTRIFERFQELYSIGRPRKINMDILTESGVVTDAYLEKISELLVAHNSDPGALMNALDQGVVKGFRTNKKEDLRNYLLEKGYLSNVAPCNDEEIHIKLSALISNLDIETGEAERFINRFVAMHDVTK